jgi:Na+/proline symporter
MIPTSFAWTAAQIKGFGQILTLLGDIDVFWATTIATTLVIVYTSLGGMMADVVTDFVQGIVLMLGLAITLYFVVQHAGGIKETLAAVDTTKLSFTGPGESIFNRMDDWSIGILGSLVSQELVSRMLAAKSPEVAKKSALTASGMYLFAGLVPVLLGLIGPKFITGLSHPDQFMPALAHEMLPTAIFVIFIGALVSAILSTVDSTLLAISAYTTHNLIGEKFYSLNDKQKVLVDRAVVIGSGIICYIMAVKAHTMYELILASNAFGSAGVLVVTFLGLWLPNFGSKKAAFAALIIGLIGNPIYEKVFHFQAPYLGAIVSAAAAFLTIGYLEKRRSENPARSIASF